MVGQMTHPSLTTNTYLIHHSHISSIHPSLLNILWLVLPSIKSLFQQPSGCILQAEDEVVLEGVQALQLEAG